MTRARRMHLTVFVLANLGAIAAIFVLCVALPAYRRANEGRFDRGDTIHPAPGEHPQRTVSPTPTVPNQDRTALDR